jgi:Eukaryotic porin
MHLCYIFIIFAIILDEMFCDIGKGVKDLLDDDYFYVQRLKISTTNESKLSWLTEGELSSKGSFASISASLKSPNLSLDNFRIKSDGRIHVEASLQTNESTKFTICAEDGRQEPGKLLHSNGKIGCEFRSPAISGKADLDIVNGPTFRSSLLYNFTDKFNFGSEIAVNTRLEEKDLSPEISDVNIGMSYKGTDWNLSAKTHDTLGTLRVSYLHSVSPKLHVCSRLDYRLKSNSQKIFVGSSYR